MVTRSFSLARTFVHLAADGKASEIAAGPDIFRNLKSRQDLQNGRLMGALDLSPGTSHWEMHPDGDEFLYLLSGSMDVELEEGNEKRCIRLSGMTGCVVPRALWHRTVVHQAGRMIFITPGKGTRHREG